MTTPELVNEEDGAFVFVANHFIATDEAFRLSIAYNKARMAHAVQNLPQRLSKCVIFYDIRGQRISNARLDALRSALSEAYEVRILSD